MNIIASLIITYAYCLVSNTILLNNLIKSLSKKNLKLNINFHNKKSRKYIINEIILNFLPIINMIHSLKTTIKFMVNENEVYENLENNQLIQPFSDWERNHIKTKTNSIGIFFASIKYSEMLKKSKKFNLVGNSYVFQHQHKQEAKEILKTFEDIENLNCEKNIDESNQIISYDLSENGNVVENSQSLKLVRKKKNKPKNI